MVRKYGDISVIIPTYNSTATVWRAIDSIAKQTLLPKEVVIVDDCSTDVSVNEILHKIEKTYKNTFEIVLVFLGKNSGPGTARNCGWDKSKGKYVAFLDSDDVWHPLKLEIQYNFMEQNQDVFLLTHGMTVINEENKAEYFSKEFRVCEKDIVAMNPKRLLFKHYSDGTPCVIMKNNNRYRFVEGKKYSEDYLLWLEVLFDNKGVFINKNLSAAFKNLYGAGGLSANLWELEKGELETFSVLKEKGYISRFLYVLCKCFSLIKYFRRIMVCYLRQI